MIIAAKATTGIVAANTSMNGFNNRFLCMRLFTQRQLQQGHSWRLIRGCEAAAQRKNF
jgi:hypothetical protein